ncbi:DUF6912 family protein [Nocardioides cavernaquae]|uniref:DUF6912 family protein n=1 Tax=Nocardioides cavernaquae TaxID=2321396 RepID=UPI001C7D58B9|nr:hypothetical protein [Nocardioides cavernaquae]
MTVRVYVPLTRAGLAAVVADGRLPGPFRAHAVTESLVAEWPDGDDEELEYAAMAAAGDASWAIRGPDDPPRRYVLAGDVPDAVPVDGEDLTLVDVAADLPWKRVSSAHVDAHDIAEADIEDTDLAWFATQEIASIV